VTCVDTGKRTLSVRNLLKATWWLQCPHEIMMSQNGPDGNGLHVPGVAANPTQSLCDTIAVLAEPMQTPANNLGHLVVPQTPEPLTAPKRTIQVPDEACFAAIQNAADLSKESKRQYAGCLTRLVAGGAGRKGGAPTPALIPGSSLVWCATHPERCCQMLQRSLNTQGLLNPRGVHNYTAALRSVMAHHPELAKLTAVRERWKRIADQLVVTPLTAEGKLNKPTERQAAGFVTYAEIAAKFRELEIGSKKSLLVGLIGLADEKMLPQRRDFGAVRLYIGCEPPLDKTASGKGMM
jgi:hypothetical protein